jgi:D-glycero-D-manno-heptose 1,7-bisphosphate phosphatase
MSVPAVFLDRDGVINENRPNDYVRDLSQLIILPNALHALRRLASSPYRIVVVTNQAGISKGLMTADAVIDIHHALSQVARHHGGRIDGFWFCPHLLAFNCDCRKPRPGLLFQAAAALDLDLSRSWLVGDAISDLQAGLAAGVRPLLVATGRGSAQALRRAEHGLQALPLFADLSAAVDFILDDNPMQPQQTWQTRHNVPSDTLMV